MTATTAAAPVTLGRDEAAGLFAQTMGLVAVTAGLFALGSYLGRDLSGGSAWLWFIAAVGALIGMNVSTSRSEPLTLSLLCGFGLLLGLAVAPGLNYYVDTDTQVVWLAGGATALFMVGFGAAGYATRRDLSALSRYLSWALVGLIGFMIVLDAAFDFCALCFVVHTARRATA
jgi:modulator of FtsH protease